LTAFFATFLAAFLAGFLAAIQGISMELVWAFRRATGTVATEGCTQV